MELIEGKSVLQTVTENDEATSEIEAKTAIQQVLEAL